MKAGQCIAIFESAIEKYHILDDVDQDWNNPFEENSVESLLYTKCWIDTVQWHLEDIIRDPNIDAENGMMIKRRIDKSNQHRTDVVEQMDDYYIDLFKDAPANPQAKINTESPGWVVDRMSILCLKIYHMEEQVARAEADEAHRINCTNKLNILLDQKKDLSSSFDELLVAIKEGERKIKVYRQMKMYNDDTLNPVLYNKDQA